MIPGKSTLVVTSDKIRNLKVALCLFNSKLWFFYISEKYSSSSYNQGITFAKDMFNNLPLPAVSDSLAASFNHLVDYILYLKQSDDAEQVNEYVSNDRLVERFEEVIDALVYELYFEEDFKAAGVCVLKHATSAFPGVEGKSDKQKREIINRAYQTLETGDSEISRSLKLMNTRLADLLAPIRTGR